MSRVVNLNILVDTSAFGDEFPKLVDSAKRSFAREIWSFWLNRCLDDQLNLLAPPQVYVRSPQESEHL